MFHAKSLAVINDCDAFDVLAELKNQKQTTTHQHRDSTHTSFAEVKLINPKHAFNV